LQRLKISYKRGRDYVHSPDDHDQAKLDLIAAAREATRRDPERYVLVHQDELTYYRQPTLAAAYEACGHVQPLAQRSQPRNSWFRVVAALNAVTGQVTYCQRSKLDVGHLGLFYAQVRADYPQAERI
jgi:hypothetical protein